jgi:hypothetical protein
LDKLENQGLKQAIIVVPEKAIGSCFHNEPLSQFGFWADWVVDPRWNLCDAPGGDNGGKVDAVKKFLDSDSKALVCTHATFRFAVGRFGIEVLDDRRVAFDVQQAYPRWHDSPRTMSYNINCGIRVSASALDYSTDYS